jgi:hypothetical protein
MARRPTHRGHSRLDPPRSFLPPYIATVDSESDGLLRQVVWMRLCYGSIEEQLLGNRSSLLSRCSQARDRFYRKFLMCFRSCG